MIPAEHAINRLMEDTGMDRVQAVRHLKDRTEVRRRVASTMGQREGQRHDK